MKITNKSPGPRGFFAKDNPLVPIMIMPGETKEVEGFNPKLPSHAAMLDAGEIVAGSDKSEEPKK
jgi:hypothetical protein